MYFIDQMTFERLIRAGVSIPDAAHGMFQHQGTPGQVVNRDALDLDRADACLPDGAQLNTRAQDDGLTILHVVEAAPEAGDASPGRPRTRRDQEPGERLPGEPVMAAVHAAQEERLARHGFPPERDPERARADAPSRPAEATPDQAPTAEAPEPPAFRQFDDDDLEDLAEDDGTGSRPTIARLVRNYRELIAEPIAVFEPVPMAPLRGLPDLSDLPAGTKTILLGCVPGTGARFHRGRRAYLDLYLPHRDDEVGLEIPTDVEIPEGMRPVLYEETPVACYDADKLLLFNASAGLSRMIVPAWLDNFVRPETEAEIAAQDDAIVQAMIATFHNRGDRENAIATELRRELRDSEQSIARLERRIQLTENLLAACPEPGIDIAAMTGQLCDILDSGDWRVLLREESLRLTRSCLLVRDPRDGCQRRIPGPIEIDVGDLCRNRGWSANSHLDNHPRMFARGFLDPTLDTALKDTVLAGDLTGALALLVEVLTSFTAHDPDVEILDQYRVTSESDAHPGPRNDSARAA